MGIVRLSMNLLNYQGIMDGDISFSHVTLLFPKQNFQKLWKPPAILSY